MKYEEEEINLTIVLTKTTQDRLFEKSIQYNALNKKYLNKQHQIETFNKSL